MEEMPFYVNYLRGELTRRVEDNPRYSLRAFAKALSMDASVLSKILSLKRNLPLRTAERLAARFGLEPEEKLHFMESVVDTQKRQGLRRFVIATQKHVPYDQWTPLSTQAGGLFTHWYHTAITELCFGEGFPADIRLVAKRLNISFTEAKMAIEGMLHAGILAKSDGKFIKTVGDFSLGPDEAFGNLRRRKQQLQKVIESFESDPPGDRMVKIFTMAIDPKKMETARKRINDFMLSMADLLESPKPNKRVSLLGVFLCPLEKQT
jgi:uncharacterized protein (TIGR02147 family)